MEESDPHDHAQIPDDWREVEHINRPRGILSPKERAHVEGLLDEDPKEDADAIRQREYRIRQHIYNAFLDFSILATEDSAHRPLSEVGNKLDEVPEETDHPHGVYTGVSRLMEILYAALGSFHPTDERVTFTSILRSSIVNVLVDHYAGAHHISIIPEVEYEVYPGEKWDLDDVMEIYHQYPEKHLLPEELDALYTGRKITREQYHEYLSDIQDTDLTSDEIMKKGKEAYERRGFEADPKGDGTFDVRWPVDSNDWEGVG